MTNQAFHSLQPRRARHPAPSPGEALNWGGWWWWGGDWQRRNALTWEEERGQAESESPPASCGARTPHPSHRGPEVRREAPWGERSSRPGNQPGRRRQVTAGRRALRGSRSAAAVGRGGVGWAGLGAAAIRAPGRRRLRGSADARRKLHESCPLLLLRSPPRAGPRPLLPRRAGLGRGTHPRRAWPPGCAARAPGPRRAHALPLGSNLQASMAGRPPRAAGRARVAGGRRGGLGAQAAGARSGGRLPGSLGLCGSAVGERAGGAARRRRSLCSGPAVRDNVEQPGRRVAPRSPRSLPFSHSPSSSLSPALPVMSARGGGARVNPLAAPARRPRPPRPPPGRAHLPARGRGGARARAGGRAGPLAGAMPLRPPCGAAQGPSAGRPALSPTKGGSDP